MITIPAKFNIPNGADFSAIKNKDGSITFFPTVKNPFQQKEYDEFDFKTDSDLFGNSSVGKEII